MKVKAILRFYFGAESLESAFENLILKRALAAASDGLESAEDICGLIDEKCRLGEFWTYLDYVMCGLTQGDRAALGQYAAMRCGVGGLDSECVKRIKKATIKFRRRARRIEQFNEAVALIHRYYTLIIV